MNRQERFETIEIIQQGLLATTFRARDRVLDRPVLLKVLQPRLAVEPELVQRFRREAMLQARLKHPNIVTVYEFGDEQDFYIASEFVEGRTMEALLRERGRLELAELAPLVIQVADALAFAHEHGVIHRDLKPANIMISSRGEAKLTDFGLAYAPDAGRLTMEGAVVGTPAYMSPEQARGRDTDLRTDIFSLGVVIYEALTGGNPFAAESHADALSLVLNRAVPRLEDVPADVIRLVGRMLAKDRDARTATIAEVGAAFRAIAGTPSRAPRRRMPVLVPVGAGGLAVAAVAVALVLAFGRGRGPAEPVMLAEPAVVVDSLPLAPPAGDSEPAAVRPEPAPAAPAVESLGLRIAVRPWAEVLVDGRQVGVTPLAGAVKVTPGEHRVTLRNPYYPELTRRVRVETDDALSIDLEQEFAFVDLVVSPWAVVAVDGEVIDTTPLARPLVLTPGEHRLELTHPEMAGLSETVRFDTAGRYRLAYDLAR